MYLRAVAKPGTVSRQEQMKSLSWPDASERTDSLRIYQFEGAGNITLGIEAQKYILNLGVTFFYTS